MTVHVYHTLIHVHVYHTLIHDCTCISHTYTVMYMTVHVYHTLIIYMCIRMDTSSQ